MDMDIGYRLFRSMNISGFHGHYRLSAVVEITLFESFVDDSFTPQRNKPA